MGGGWTKMKLMLSQIKLKFALNFAKKQEYIYLTVAMAEEASLDRSVGSVERR